MAIYDVLSGLKDDNYLNGECMFNGDLSDYIKTWKDDEDHAEEAFLVTVSEMFPSIKVCVKLRLEIKQDAIANQIIRYRDAFKLSYGAIKCPYVLYQDSGNQQKAMIVGLGSQNDYLLTKGLYYVMSEPDNKFEGSRNEIIAATFNDEDKTFFFDALNVYFGSNEKAGVVQRNLDRHMFETYDEMYEAARELAAHQANDYAEILRDSSNVELEINTLVVNWFLLKKLCYVQYMMDKRVLNNLHEGDMKKHRHMAKLNAEAIQFVSLHELWVAVKQIRYE